MNALRSPGDLKPQSLAGRIRKLSAHGIILGMFAVPILAAESAPYYFSTLAGISSVGSTDGPADAARFNKPVSVALDLQGNLYVADSGNKAVRMITPTGVVTTIAGRAGDARSVDGPAAQARFTVVDDVAVDAQGAVLVADRTVLRRISTDGQVTTLAGDPSSTPGGDKLDGVGTAARFSYLSRLAFAPDGTLVVRDAGILRRVTMNGVVTTLNQAPADWFRGDFAIDGAGVIYSAPDHTIVKTSPDGTSTTLAGSAGLTGAIDGLGVAARFDTTEAIALDLTGTIYVTDTDNHAIRAVTPAGQVTTLAGRLHPATDSYESRIGAQDGIGAAASFNVPSGMAVDRSGNVYVADRDNNTIRKITPQGLVTTVAGMAPSRAAGQVDGGLANARFNAPADIAVTSDGTCYVADAANHVIRQISATGTVSTLAGSPGQPGYVDGAGSAARLNFPHALAVDKSGNVYVLEASSTVRKITPAGIVTTVAGNGLSTTESITGQKTPNSEESYQTGGIAVAGNGDLYVSEGGLVHNTYYYYFVYTARVFKITAAGTITTEVDSSDSHGSWIQDLAIGPDGNLYYCIPYYQSVYKKKPGADPERIFFSDFAPTRIAVSASNRVFLTDGYPYDWARIAELQTDGSLNVIGGRQHQSAHVDGVGTNALFSGLAGIAVDSHDSLYLACADHTIRLGSPATAPVIRTQPQSQTVAAGGDVQFAVSAAAVPEPSYQWFCNGAAINGATAATYRFTNARASDAGEYSVTVSNELGTTTSVKATLTVSSASTLPNGGGGASGGGSLSLWFAGGLSLLWLFRLAQSGLFARDRNNSE